MKLNNIDISSTLDELRQSLAAEKELSPSLKVLIEVLMVVVQLLADQLGLNSQNSSKPPSSDMSSLKSTRKVSGKKTGGQPGHRGSTLKQVDEPDNIEILPLDRCTLPKGRYKDAGIEKRQVIDIEFCRVVTEYQAQILEDEQGKRYVAEFPQGVGKAVQYGNTLKAHVVYLSQYQLLPYQRVAEYFSGQLNVAISEGSIANFNKQAFEQLATFNEAAKVKLSGSARLHVDETGVNINGQRQWLHCASNDDWTDFTVHAKRGEEAMTDANILPHFTGVLCHDHWKPYYRFRGCEHSLCNAHHLRELTRAYEQDGQQWAGRMKALLEIINRAVHQAGGMLDEIQNQRYKNYYHRLLKQGDIECPAPKKEKKRKRGRVKRSKARNLLERLLDYEDDVLRFMSEPDVPFTNNLGERDIRMTKVHQKISGCFRSQDGADIFCRVRGYLSTCRKQGVNASVAMTLLFEGKLPDFIEQ